MFRRAVGLLTAAFGLVLLAFVPGWAALFVAALAFGLMTETVTPLAFAHLADTTPDARMGRTMGNAELGRELGDAGGLLLVGTIATAWTLPGALLVPAGIAGAAALASRGAAGEARAKPRP